MVYCDVCELPLIIEGLGSDEEKLKVICPECGFDNGYQFRESRMEVEIDVFLDANDIYDDEILLIAMAERFGTDVDDLKDMITEKEMLGWGIRVIKK